MDIKKQMVMLPSDKKASIVNFLDNNKLIYIGNQTFDSSIPFGFCHLYILSDDEIKKGDWYLTFQNNQVIGELRKCEDSSYSFIHCKKIIATTDKSLSVVKEKAGENVWTQQIPQIPQSFIEHYVSEYNKGNVITEVMVEYNEPCCKCDTTEKVINCKYSVGLEGCNAPDPNKDFYGIRPKVDPKDNSINIKPVKDSWSKEELINAFEDFACAVFNENYKSDMSFKKRAELMSKKWIEENL